MAKTLKDVMPREFMGCEYDGCRARKLADVEVLSEHEFNWPGDHRNVVSWVKLVNGKAVGWNESPARGWAFPVITLGDRT